MQNRTEKRFKSCKLQTGFRFGYYNDLATVINELGDKGQEKVLEIVNRQLSAHVTATWARDQFTTDIERVTGFSFLTKVAKKKDGTEYNVPDESEADYIDRFRKSMVEGYTFTPASDLGTKVGKPEDNDDEVSIANELKALAHHHPGQTPEAIEKWLQTLADLRVYPLDAKVTERVAKEKGLPKYATDGAAAIYAGNADKGLDSEANWNAWAKKFSKNNVTLVARTGDKDVDLKVLAQAIVANEAAEAKNKYK